MVFWLQNHHDWRAMCKTLNILRMFKSRGHEGDTKGTLYFELCLAARVPNFDVSILFDSFIWSWHCFHNAAQRPYNRGFQRHPVSSLCRWLWNDLGNCSNHLWSLDSKPCKMCGVVLGSPGLPPQFKTAVSFVWWSCFCPWKRTNHLFIQFIRLMGIGTGQRHSFMSLQATTSKKISSLCTEVQGYTSHQGLKQL